MTRSTMAGVCAVTLIVACGRDREAATTSRSAEPAARPPATSRPGPELPAKADAPVERVDIGDGKTMWIAPLRHRNLALLPVSIAPASIDPTDYLTLDEGMKAEQIEIKEVSSEGSVNALALRNRSEQPLFLLAGEVIIGGKQDRIIAKTTVIAAGEKIEVPVFCVEQGRWDGRKADFSSAESIAHLGLRNVAEYGDQGKVWQEVSAKNASRGESNATDTYRGVALQKGVVDDYRRAIEPAFEKAYPGGAIGSERITGFAVAYNGRIVGIEAFRSPSLFAKLRGKLMHSYYVDAIDREYDQAASDAPMDAEAVNKGGRYKRKYAEDDGAADEVYGNASSATTSWSNSDVRGTEVRLKGKDGKTAAKPVYEKGAM